MVMCVSELPAVPEQKTSVGHRSRKSGIIDIPAKWLPRELDQGLSSLLVSLHLCLISTSSLVLYLILYE